MKFIEFGIKSHRGILSYVFNKIDASRRNHDAVGGK